MSSIEALQSIANDISTGFEVLLDRLDAQRRVEEDLRQQLASAAGRVSGESCITYDSWCYQLALDLSSLYGFEAMYNNYSDF